MGISFWQIAIVVVLVVLLFGRGKISSLMGDVAKGIKSFKKGMSSEDNNKENIDSPENKDEDSETQNKYLIMPQIGWFEILIIVVIAILVIGPKDFPVVLKKIGNWIGSTKRYFSSIQNKMNEIEETVEDEVSVEKQSSKKTKDNNNE